MYDIDNRLSGEICGLEYQDHTNTLVTIKWLAIRGIDFVLFNCNCCKRHNETIASDTGREIFIHYLGTARPMIEIC